MFFFAKINFVQFEIMPTIFDVRALTHMYKLATLDDDDVTLNSIVKLFKISNFVLIVNGLLCMPDRALLCSARLGCTMCCAVYIGPVELLYKRFEDMNSYEN